MTLLLLALWSFFPAGLANMAPVFAKRIPMPEALGRPVDLGKSFRGKRIFGDNKTFRGFVAGFIFALAGVWMQRELFPTCSSCQLEFQNYMAINPVLLAALFTIGALGGDAIESFFKRQLGKKPGSTWFPFDQGDFIIGGLLATWPVMKYSVQLAGVILVMGVVLHVVSTYIGHWLGLKEKPI